MNLFDLYQKRTDVLRFNETLVNGLAVSELKDGVGYLNHLISQIKDTFAEGITFDGAFLCDPIREVERSLIRGTTTTMKMEQNHTAMVEVKFSLHGRYAASGYLRIPYLTRGGECIINGKQWNYASVMVDRGINIKKDNLFIFLSRARYLYHRTRHEFLRNGRLDVDNILTGRLHQQNESARKASLTNGPDLVRNAEPNLMIYLLIDSGFVGCCKKYFDTDVIVEKGSYEVLRNKYPGAAIYSSTNAPVKYIHPERITDVSSWHIIVKEDTALTQKLAVNLVYILDIFGYAIDDVSDLEDTELWKLIAGRFIFNTDETIPKLIEKVEKHLDQSISRLIDDTTKTELMLDNIHVNDTNELLVWLIKETDSLYRTKEINSVANKRLTTTRYAFGYMQDAVTKLSYAMKHINPDTLTPKKLGQILRTHFREGSLRQSVVGDATWRNEKYSADNVWVLTRNVIQQSNVRMAGKKASKLMYLPENKMHGSKLTITQVAGLPKSDLSMTAYINPYIKLGVGGRIIPQPDYNPAVEALNKLIKSRG